MELDQIIEVLGNMPATVNGSLLPTPADRDALRFCDAAKTYTGPMTQRDWPRLREFRLHAGIMDVRRSEIKAAVRAAREG